MNTEKHPNHLLFEQIAGNSKDLVDFMKYTALSPSPSSSIFTEIRSRITEPIFLRKDQLSMSQKAEIADALFQSLVVWLEKTRTKEELRAFPEEWQSLLAKGLADTLLLRSSSLSNI